MNNKKPREERLTLKQTRDKTFDCFRRNLRMLRASVDISATELSAKIPLRNGSRCVDLEYGRGNPATQELLSISKYFKVPLDDLMFKKAKIIFE